MTDDIYDPEFHIKKVKQALREKGYAAGKKNLLAYHEARKAGLIKPKPKPKKRGRPRKTWPGRRKCGLAGGPAAVKVTGGINKIHADACYRVKVVRGIMDKIDPTEYSTIELCEMIKAALLLEKPPKV